MTDPVMAADGIIYERASIKEWLKNNNTSPVSGKTLINKNLIKEDNLK